MIRLFNRSFWSSSALPALAALLALHLWWSTARASFAPLPSWPFSAATYLAEYEVRGQVTHCLYRFGLFGTGTRIRQADLLVVGTSHPQFGISAALLSERLSASAGRPIQVFNLGLGYAEGWAFIGHVLEANRIHDRPLLIDLFMPRGNSISPWATRIDGGDATSAFAQVVVIWSEFTHDWLLDAVLPHLLFEPTSRSKWESRPFVQQFLTRRWDTGDVALAWSPDAGPLYTETPPQCIQRITDLVGTRSPLPPSYFQVPPEALPVIERNHLHPLLTLVPFADENLSQCVQAATKLGWPLILISGQDLFTWDPGAGHVNAASRTVATERLAEKIAPLRLFEIAGHP